MTATMMPRELFEPKGVDSSYVSFLVNEHRKIYLGTRAIVRLSYGRAKGEVLTCHTATYRLVRLLQEMAPKALSVDGLVLWVDANPDGSYTRHLITKDQYSRLV